MSDWKSQPQGGGRSALRVARLIAGIGRPLARTLLWPVSGYYYLRRKADRRASRDFLQRVRGAPARPWHVLRHIHTFAASTLDRVYLLGAGLAGFDIRTQGLAELDAQLDRGRGVLVIGSHLGSFDAMRVLSTHRPEVAVRVVLDRGHSRDMQELLDAVNPQLAAGIIDAAQDGPSIALAIKQAADAGALVAMLADRAQPGEPGVRVPFLGREAAFPVAPWLIAATLKLPVMLAFGLYRGGRRYELVFEPFSEGLDIPRHDRAARLAECVQRYAARLEHHARRAPYNWFNFYDFWPDTAAGRAAVAGDGAHARRPA